MTAPQSADVVVVGAGVIGVSIARLLAKAGMDVLVVDRAGVGAEASSAAAGILAPRVHATSEGLFDLAMASHHLFPQLAADLRAESGTDVEYARSGVLDVALTESEEEVLHDKVRWLSQQGHPVRWLDRSEVLSREPALTPGLRGAFLDEDAYQIHPARFTQALGSAAARAGARFRLGLDVTGVATERQRVTRILTSEGAIAANHLVLATGAWLRVAGSWLGVTLPVAPVKGQILTVTAVPSPVDAIIFGAEIYLLPRTEGQIVVGATAERAGFDKSLTADALAWLLGTIPTLCPSLRGARFERAWAGLRPGSPDELPIVGPAPGWENVTVAGGHFRNGIMLTPITARLVADLILRNTSDALLAPLSPARFGTATS